MSGPGFFNLLRWELSKLARRRASYVGFVLCGAFCLAVATGFYWSKWWSLRRWGQALPFDPVDMINGPFYANFVLLIGFFALMPLLTATVAGSQIAGEARDGTLRAILVRPVGRVTLYWAKVAATYIWLQLILLFLVGFALLVGIVFKGGGPLLVFVWELRADGPWLIEPSQWAWLLFAASIGAGLSLFVVASLAMMLSTLTDSPAVAHVGSLGAYLISSVLQRLPGDLVPDELRELLPTTHMSYWHELYRLTNPNVTFDSSRFASDVLWCAGFAAVFLAIGAIVFRRRDITA
jgi:ABC-2 type transport system permease protein